MAKIKENSSGKSKKSQPLPGEKYLTKDNANLIKIIISQMKIKKIYKNIEEVTELKKTYNQLNNKDPHLCRRIPAIKELYNKYRAEKQRDTNNLYELFNTTSLTQSNFQNMLDFLTSNLIDGDARIAHSVNLDKCTNKYLAKLIQTTQKEEKSNKIIQQFKTNGNKSKINEDQNQSELLALQNKMEKRLQKPFAKDIDKLSSVEIYENGHIVIPTTSPNTQEVNSLLIEIIITQKINKTLQKLKKLNNKLQSKNINIKGINQKFSALKDEYNKIQEEERGYKDVNIQSPQKFRIIFPVTKKLYEYYSKDTNQVLTNYCQFQIVKINKQIKNHNNSILFYSKPHPLCQFNSTIINNEPEVAKRLIIKLLNEEKNLSKDYGLQLDSYKYAVKATKTHNYDISKFNRRNNPPATK